MLTSIIVISNSLFYVCLCVYNKNIKQNICHVLFKHNSNIIFLCVQMAHTSCDIDNILPNTLYKLTN